MALDLEPGVRELLAMEKSAATPLNAGALFEPSQRQWRQHSRRGIGRTSWSWQSEDSTEGQDSAKTSGSSKTHISAEVAGRADAQGAGASSSTPKGKAGAKAETSTEVGTLWDVSESLDHQTPPC